MFWTKTIRNKIVELQIQFESILPQFELSLQANEYTFGFAFNVCNLFALDFNWTRKVSHAGIRTDFALFGLHIRTEFVDRRHWDYKLNRWV
jgi:hypothetical protein